MNKQFSTFNTDFPLYTTFNLTSLCNANYLHCSSNSTDKSVEDLDTEKLLSILNELKACGILQIGFTGGEPLLHPDFDKIIERTLSLGFITSIGTNGYVVDESIIQRIKKLGIHISPLLLSQVS